ncbi:hypothetical protein O9G_004364 [Rozella allomycis CSF55]|uniref:Uncharacterized protein n=1 Tax=Rozella allomycis (strain CSF55) TaxID=988480 RepID=A0A075AZM2_ROZAC|nr:hypothetical protein O9G_004364 [Rozella allomycis CSF55]|eukprot:EPZ35707.1 hypothetical protein O9G_004364 [Rozella allomycis CSF55]
MFNNDFRKSLILTNWIQLLLHRNAQNVEWLLRRDVHVARQAGIAVDNAKSHTGICIRNFAIQ